MLCFPLDKTKYSQKRIFKIHSDKTCDIVPICTLLISPQCVEQHHEVSRATFNLISWNGFWAKLHFSINAVHIIPPNSTIGQLALTVHPNEIVARRGPSLSWQWGKWYKSHADFCWKFRRLGNSYTVNWDKKQDLKNINKYFKKGRPSPWNYQLRV